jgi:hypothetical protein
MRSTVLLSASFLRCRHLILGALLLWSLASNAQVILTSGGQPQAVIMTRPNPPGYIQLAAQEFQQHLQIMSGATLPIAVVGTEAAYPGSHFVYIGISAGTIAAGLSTVGLDLEYYHLRTLNGNLHIVGRDGGDDEWENLSDCQPGTLFGVYHLLSDVLGVRWIWPGESGRQVPTKASVTVPALNVTTGPALVQRKFRTPRIGAYLNGVDSYGFGVPVLPTSDARKRELALEELLWLRRMRMGTRKNVSFAHSFTQWWSFYGTTHPEYFAELLPGRTHPHPAADRVKLHESSPAVWQQRIDDWVAAGAGSNVNICPNDSRSFCVCSDCRAWDRPAQTPEIVFSSSDARLSDRMARFYTEIANRVKVINPNATVYGYAYDVYQQAPIEATVPNNVALAYIPDAPSDVKIPDIAASENDILGWIAKGCTQMYLRPNWMLSGHAGPYWPSHRLGEHFKRLLLSGNIKGFDSDSSCSSYASFGLYYYLVCRLITDPTLPVETILDEYCSAFGSASSDVRAYFDYWENFINNQADAGNNSILAWSACVPAYGTAYSDKAFDGALRLLDRAYARLAPSETSERERLDFLRLACLHGRLTAQAIALVSPTLPLSSNPQAEKAMRALLAFRDEHAESFALWREWMIDRENFVPNMRTYWQAILANPGVGYGSNVGAFIESEGQVVMEAEHCTASQPGTGTAAGVTWQEISGTAGASGTVMQALPNSDPGINTDTQTNGPRLDFKIDFRTTGTYYVFVRMPATAGTDDSVNIGLDGTRLSSNLNNTSGAFRWRTTTPSTFTLDIITPGVRTFNVWMREDGVMVDKILLTTNPTLPFSVNDLGPAESGTRGSTEHLLTVSGGSGDGHYGTDSMVAITANAAPPNFIFHRWNGDTSGILNLTSASTYLTMPALATAVSASYRMDPALDTDQDGMLDTWETTQFTHLTNANTASDFDKDGSSDLAESIAGTAPKDAQSLLKIESITSTSSDDLTVTWQGIAGKSYTLETSTSLHSDEWLPLSIGIPGTEPVTSFSLSRHAASRYVRIVVE